MDLTQKKCVPCEGGLAPLSAAEEAEHLKLVNGWGINRDAIHFIHKDFKFEDFVAAIGFINRVAEVAEAEGHHPDLHNHYNRVRVEIHTHAIKGLHLNDFVLAAKIDRRVAG